MPRHPARVPAEGLGYPGDPPKWCPPCEPDLDPTKTIVIEYRCYKHTEPLTGGADEQMESILTERLGSDRTDGETQRAWARMLDTEGAC